MSEEQDCLLAVSFSSPTTGEDSALFSYSLSGNTVCDILIVVSISQVFFILIETSKLNATLWTSLLRHLKVICSITFVQI
jgi:hypothetical protein